MDKNISVPI